MALEAIMRLIEWQRRQAEIFDRDEEIHQAKLAAIQPRAAPPYRTAADVAKELNVKVRRAQIIVEENQRRLGIEHKHGQHWRLTEEQFQRIIAMKQK